MIQLTLVIKRVHFIWAIAFQLQSSHHNSIPVWCWDFSAFPDPFPASPNCWNPGKPRPSIRRPYAEPWTLGESESFDRTKCNSTKSNGQIVFFVVTRVSQPLKCLIMDKNWSSVLRTCMTSYFHYIPWESYATTLNNAFNACVTLNKPRELIKTANPTAGAWITGLSMPSDRGRGGGLRPGAGGSVSAKLLPGKHRGGIPGLIRLQPLEF